MTASLLNIKVYTSIEHIDKYAWGQLVGTSFPFSEYSFLSALESSGCVGRNTGWAPQYITAWQDHELVGATFVYLKTNSYGEYIFDWDWAKAYRNYGIDYFPKLTASIPFTPATGQKFLTKSPLKSDAIIEALLAKSLEMLTEHGCSSLHYLFVPKNELKYFEAKAFLIRHSVQYHWHNRGYETFSSFLATMKPKRSKQIRRERTQLQSTNIDIRWFTGASLTSAHADLFYRFYSATIEKMAAIAYLNQEFFRTVFSELRHEIVLLVAFEGDQAIAGALYFTKGDQLFGRYWGASKDIRNLHFEICYYQSIEWAIANKIEKFEAGAQGEHKIARGFLPELTYSAHWIEHREFRTAIGRFIEDEKSGIQRYLDEMKAHHPFL